jgi:polyhydroxyalkanoate synthase
MDTSVTFLLTNGGHNGGIVSEPGHKGRRYRIRSKQEGDRYLDPDAWMKETEPNDGSWWPRWVAWLAEHSGKDVVAPPKSADQAIPSLGDAPGSYVLQR